MNKVKNRYGDAELSEFREIIESKLVEAREDLLILKGSLSHKDDHGAFSTFEPVVPVDIRDTSFL